MVDLIPVVSEADSHLGRLIRDSDGLLEIQLARSAQLQPPYM